MTLTRKLMASAGLLALSTGLAAAAPAIVQSDVNLRAGPGTDYEVIAAMPAGATVDVMGCEATWCQVSFAGTAGFASRAYLGLGAAAVAVPAYREDYAVGASGPDYSYEGGDYGYGYAPGAYGTATYGAYYGERDFRGDRRENGVRVGFGEGREFQGNREFRGERRDRGDRFSAREERGRVRTSTEIEGNNPMKNPKGAVAASTSRNGARGGAEVRTQARGSGASANATTGAAARGSGGEQRGVNFIGSGAKFRDNHP